MRLHFSAIALTAALAASTTYASEFSGKKVLFINSYHAGYAWSDQIAESVQEVIAPTGAEVITFEMDTKRNTSEEFKKEVGAKVKAMIAELAPDVVIAADDNAQSYVIAPDFVGGDLPVVFAGVNWDASGYGYPASNVTGMIEVSPTKEIVEVLTEITGGDRFAYLTTDSVTERKEIENVEQVLKLRFAETVRVNSFDEWTAAFKRLQGEVDGIVLGSTAGMEGYDAAAAEAFVLEHVRIPVAGYYDWLRPLTLFNLEKRAAEQGTWAAEAALRILGGESPADIPVTQNQESYLTINARVAEASGVEVPGALIEAANEIIE